MPFGRSTASYPLYLKYHYTAVDIVDVYRLSLSPTRRVNKYYLSPVRATIYVGVQR